MAEVEADPLFTVEGAAKDEEWKLLGPRYHLFIKRMKDAWSPTWSSSFLRYFVFSNGSLGSFAGLHILESSKQAYPMKHGGTTNQMRA